MITTLRRLTIPARSTALACLMAATGLVASAQDEPPAPQTPSLKTLGSEALSPTSVLSAIELTIEPGHSSPSHRHDSTVFAYVLEGEIRSRIDDGPIVLYRTGDSWFEPLGVEHSFFENASDTERARFLVVQVGPPREAAPQ